MKNVKTAAPVAAKVKNLKKVVAEVNAGTTAVEKLSPGQKKIVDKVNELQGKKTATAVSTLPTKKELLKTKKAEQAIPTSHDAEIDAMLAEVKEAAEAEQTSKKRAPKGTIIKVAEVKGCKPWGKNGANGFNQPLDGFEKGDKVMFNLKGVQTEGEYSHFHISKLAPKGYVTIKIGKLIFERVAEKVTKVAAVETKPVAKAAKTAKAVKA